MFNQVASSGLRVLLTPKGDCIPKHLHDLVNIVVIELPRVSQVELFDFFQDLLVRLVKFIRAPIEQKLRPQERPVLVQMVPKPGVADERGGVVDTCSEK